MGRITTTGYQNPIKIGDIKYFYDFFHQFGAKNTKMYKFATQSLYYEEN